MPAAEHFLKFLCVLKKRQDGGFEAYYNRRNNYWCEEEYLASYGFRSWAEFNPSAYRSAWSAISASWGTIDLGALAKCSHLPDAMSPDVINVAVLYCVILDGSSGEKPFQMPAFGQEERALRRIFPDYPVVWQDGWPFNLYPLALSTNVGSSGQGGGEARGVHLSFIVSSPDDYLEWVRSGPGLNPRALVGNSDPILAADMLVSRMRNCEELIAIVDAGELDWICGQIRIQGAWAFVRESALSRSRPEALLETLRQSVLDMGSEGGDLEWASFKERIRELRDSRAVDRR